MIKDAESHAAEDKAYRQKTDLKNRVDQEIYQAEKQLKEYGQKMDSDMKTKIEAAVGRLRKAQEKENVEEMKSSSEALMALMHEFSATMYKQQTSTGQPGDVPKPGAGANNKDSDAVDADFEVVK